MAIGKDLGGGGSCVWAQAFWSCCYKAPQREKIESRGYTIIANMGDQPSDLAGGHAERVYLLPNPFYRIP